MNPCRLTLGPEGREVLERERERSVWPGTLLGFVQCQLGLSARVSVFFFFFRKEKKIENFFFFLKKSLRKILQARILEWIAISSSRGSSRPRDPTWGFYVSCIARWVLYPLVSPRKPFNP